MKPEKNKADVPNTNGTETRNSSDSNRDQIEKQAYFYWLEGGCQDGCHEDHWFRAERGLSSQESAARQAA
jgi:Protein of unknown function (DUF2934)